MQSQLRLKRDHHNVHTEEVNEIVLNCNDDKRFQIFNRIKTQPYRTNPFKAYESQMPSKIHCKVQIINFDDIVIKIRLNTIKTGHIFQAIHTKYQ